MAPLLATMSMDVHDFVYTAKILSAVPGGIVEPVGPVGPVQVDSWKVHELVDAVNRTFCIVHRALLTQRVFADLAMREIIIKTPERWIH